MNQQSSDGYFETYWPRGARRAITKQLAPRLKTLEGKRVAFLWDFLFRGDEMFDAIEQELRRRFAGISFLGWKEIGNIHGNDERKTVSEKAAGVDAVITAVAA
jgi:hypothetical protein